MDTGSLTLFAIVLVIVSNQIVRMPFVRDRMWIFWAVVALDGLGAAAVLTFGLPGLVPVAKWMVAALFLFHLVQNLQRRTQWRVEASEERREADFRERHRQRELEEDQQARSAAATGPTPTPPSDPKGRTEVDSPT